MMKFAVMSDARLVNMAEHLIYPLIQNKITDLNVEMNAKFKNGQKDFIAEVAKLSVYLDLIDDLKSIQTKGNQEYKKLNNEIK